MSTTKGEELRAAFAGWMREYPFTGFLTLTVPYGLSGHHQMPANLQHRLDGLMKGYKRREGTGAGALGACIISYGGYFHTHLVALKENGERFKPDDLAWFERAWPHNADARQITSLGPLTEYLASQKHIIECKTWEPVFCGDEALKKTSLKRK